MTTLQVPYTSPTRTISIKNPELGDDREVNLQTKVKFAMSGKIFAYKKGSIEKLNYTWVDLTAVKAEELQAFMIEAADQDIKITDYRGDIWRVKCITQDYEFTTSSTNNGQGPRTEAKGITLQFEGVKV